MNRTNREKWDCPFTTVYTAYLNHLVDFIPLLNYSIQQALLPQLQPLDRVNARSVVVLDNASIHHVDGVVDLIESTGALVGEDCKNGIEHARCE